MLLSLILGSSPHLPVSVCGTGTSIQFLQAFLASVLLGNSLLLFSLYLSIRVFPLPRFPSTPVSLASFKYFGGAGISTCCPSDTPFGLSLGPDLPWADEPSPGILRLSMAPFLPKLQGHFAEFLNNASPAGLRILSSSTCVGLRYGCHVNNSGFSRQPVQLLRYFCSLRITALDCQTVLPA